jgi:hypothetical protein
MSLTNNHISGMYFFLEENNHYGLRLLFQLKVGFLYFDCLKFVIVGDETIRNSYDWKKIEYEALRNDIFIVRIKEDEVTSYFIEFSNGDIFFVNQRIDGTEFFYLDFEIVKKDNIARFARVKAYMEEDFVEDVVL